MFPAHAEQVDALPSHVVLVTASNHPEMLDRAAWRRFQVRLELPMPGPERIRLWLQRFEKKTGLQLHPCIDRLAGKLRGLSFAEIEDFGLDAARRAALDGPNADMDRIIQERLRQSGRSAGTEIRHRVRSMPRPRKRGRTPPERPSPATGGKRVRKVPEKN